jgi:hypothetical protein
LNYSITLPENQLQKTTPGSTASKNISLKIGKPEGFKLDLPNHYYHRLNNNRRTQSKTLESHALPKNTMSSLH